MGAAAVQVPDGNVEVEVCVRDGDEQTIFQQGIASYSPTADA